jgi:hypothetical protein
LFDPWIGGLEGRRARGPMRVWSIEYGVSGE